METRSLQDVPCDALVVNLFEGVTHPGGATGAADQALEGLISAAIAAGDFRGDLGQVLTLYSGGRLSARKVLVVGLGPANQFDLARARRVSAIAARKAWQGGARVIASVAHGAGIGGLNPQAAAGVTVAGALSGLYQFAGYAETGARRRPPAEAFVLVEGDAGRAQAMAAAVAPAQVVAEAEALARNLGNQPANLLTPAALAEAAQEMASVAGLECQVLTPAELEQEGLGLLLAVARGSSEPARLIVLGYPGRPPSGGAAVPLGAPLALVGKGVTFDSGGVSLKPADGMWNMKYDMCGGAAVIGAMQAIAHLQPAQPVLGIVPATENLPAGNALKPGDVVRGLSGKSVEIRSTDAEGRLILADAVAYAARRGAGRILEASTLTGAVLVALGKEAFGVLANDAAWQAEVLAAAEAAGERAWPLPTYPEYRELLQSDIADMTNGGKRQALASQGGLFILQHCGGVPTVHLDIAGTAYVEEGQPYASAGATGSALRTMVEAAMRSGTDSA